MTEKEAYDLFGLRPGASDDAVKKKYKDLVKKVHPDQGGTAALFRQVQEAYELLTNKKKGTSQGSSGSANAEYADGAEERRNEKKKHAVAKQRSNVAGLKKNSESSEKKNA